MTEEARPACAVGRCVGGTHARTRGHRAQERREWFLRAKLLNRAGMHRFHADFFNQERVNRCPPRVRLCYAI